MTKTKAGGLRVLEALNFFMADMQAESGRSSACFCWRIIGKAG